MLNWLRLVFLLPKILYKKCLIRILFVSNGSFCPHPPPPHQLGLMVNSQHLPKASSFDRVLHTLYFSLYEYFLSKEIFPPRKVGEAFYATELLVHVIKVLLRSKETDVNQQFPFFFLLRGRKKREKYQIIKLYNEAKPDSNLNFDIIMISLKIFFRNSESFKAKDLKNDIS